MKYHRNNILTESIAKDRMVYALFFFSFIFFILFMVDTPTNGDTYVYAHSISTFEGPIIHIGYYILGFICHFILKLFGSTPLQTLGILSVFCGSVSVASMYIFTFILTENRLQGLLAALILMFSGTFWFFSIHGEVYVPQLCFVLLSVLFIMKKRALLSSLSILVAISITPTSCLAFPPLFYLMYVNRLGKRQIIHFIIPIFVSLIFIIIWDFSEIIGIINWAIHPPKEFFKSFSYKAVSVEILYRLIKVYGKSFNLISFIAIFGFIALYKKEDKKSWWLMTVFFLPFSLYLFNMGLFSGDHLIISFIPISFLSSCGIVQLFNTKNIISQTKYVAFAFLIFSYLWISYQLFIRPEMRDAKEFSRVINKLASGYKDNAVMISDYNFGMAFWYKTNKDEDYFILTGRPKKMLEEDPRGRGYALEKLKKKYWINLSSRPDYFSDTYFKKIFDERYVYFVDRSDWPTWIVKILLKRKSLEERKHEVTKLKRTERYLQKTLNKKIEFMKIIDSPMQPVYLLKKA
jgi:hypothetical protein